MNHSNGTTWYRGQLHTHTYLSDGSGFPEQIVDAYRQRGYQFLCISDHNRFADDTQFWRTVELEEGRWPPSVTHTNLDAYVQAFGSDSVDIRKDEKGTSVRIKTYDEIKAMFEEPGRFILMPGVEVTQMTGGLHIHMNYINIPKLLPGIEEVGIVHRVDAPATTTSLLAKSADEAAQLATQLGRPHVFMLNHPLWMHYDVAPQSLIDCPQVRFFEVCNNGANHPANPDAAGYDVEKFWDIVNAFRSERGEPLVYGVGSDDAHYCDKDRIDGVNGVEIAWIMVRAAALEPDKLLGAMDAGDFYATSGVLLDEVTWTAKGNTPGTLGVKVHAEPGVKYRIEFVTTRHGFDPSVKHVIQPAQNGRVERRIPIYSDQIGRVVQTVEGVEASYQLQPEDLYVRARVVSDVPARFTKPFFPLTQTAWTQPMKAGR